MDLQVEFLVIKNGEKMQLLDNIEQNTKPLQEGRVLKLLEEGSPVLRQKSAPYVGDVKTDNVFRQFCLDLVTTMLANRGLGLSAVQVGSPTMVFVVLDDKNVPQVMINPVVTPDSESVRIREGCLSFPGLFLNVWRPVGCTVKYMTPDGEYLTIGAEGMFARAILHENAHLNGELFIDEVSSIDLKGARRKALIARRQLASSKRRATGNLAST